MSGRLPAPLEHRAVFAIAAAAVACCVLAAAPAPQTQPASPARTRPNLDEARRAAAELPRLHSLLVSRRDELILEHYGKGFSATRHANVKSVSKSVISALIGIAIDRKLIAGVDAPIAPYFPQLARDPDARKRQITIEDLLTMRSGLESTSFDNYGSWVGSRNWIDFVLARPMIANRGESVEYSTGSTHLLSAILTKASKRDTHRFAQEALATPLGFTLMRWPRDPQGIYFGGNDMLLTPRQMLALGSLYLHKGRAKGRQIVPERWVETSCAPRGRSRFNPDQGYGYGWWTREFAGRRACFAWGFGGQYILVFADLDLVVVTTSSPNVSDDRRDHRRAIFDILERLIVPSID